MGGGDTTTSSSNNRIAIPPWLKPLLLNTSNAWLGAQQGTPNLEQLYKNVPGLQVPNLTGEQNTLINQLTGLGNAAFNYLGGTPTSQALNTVNGFGGQTPVNPSNLNQAGGAAPTPTPPNPAPSLPNPIIEPSPKKGKKGAAVPGFATGGGFTVDGKTGTDSQLVQFLATPGEKVTVTTPQQETALSKLAGGQSLPGFATGGQATVQQPKGWGGQPMNMGLNTGAFQQNAQNAYNNYQQTQQQQQPQGNGITNTGQTPHGGVAVFGQPQPAGNPAASNNVMQMKPGGGNGYALNNVAGAQPPQSVATPQQPSLNGGSMKYGQPAGNPGNTPALPPPSGNPVPAQGNGVLDPQQLAASNTLASFLGTPGTPSAATQAEIKEFNQLQAPQIQTQANLMGLGQSGAALQALSTGQAQALVPFLQQDQANTLSAAGGMANLGAQGAQQAQTQLQNALQAAGMPYDVAANQAQALYQQLSNQFNFGQQIQEGPANLFGNVFGGGSSTGSSTSTPSKL